MNAQPIRILKVQTVLKEKINVNLDIPEHLPNIEVAPRVLASLVENAIKHGITDDFQRPVTIKLAINDQIEFTTHNWIDFRTAKTSTGFGKEILIGLLETHYGNNFQLSLNETSKEFFSRLTLPK